MAATTPLLSVQNLEVGFSTYRGNVKAVDKTSFSIFPGETVAIVGESGSGKSVTSLALMRLLNTPPAQVWGQAVFRTKAFGEVDLLQVPEKQMQRLRGNDISMIFQEPMTSLNPVYTCGKQVAEVLLLHKKLSEKEARERTIALFEQVKLPRPEKIYKAYPHEISGGQKQRVMIAMAMACNPALLIADEPTTALDVTVQARVLDLINELREEQNMAVLFITHDLGVVAEIADRILVMYRGQLVEQGPVLDIFQNPQHPYTKGLLACRPTLNTTSRVLPTVADFMEQDAEGRLVEKRQPTEQSLQDVVDNYVQLVTETKRKQDIASQKTPLLKVENLKVHFPIKSGFFGRTTDYVKAVDGVSFEVFAGETIGLVGESGCGKTTLGRTLLRLVDPTEGSILFDGTDWAKLSAEDLRRRRLHFQMIFQDPYAALNPMMTIGEAIMEPMRVHRVLANDRERRERAMELLETVGLGPEHFQRYPHEFSGGQRQRICIARALALRPKCIICDESVSALDVSVQAQVLNLLNKLKRDYGITYIFITHDLSVAKFMSDRIFVMSKGQIVESGPAEQVYQRPKQEYTRELIASIPKGDLADIQAAQQKRNAAKNGIR